MSELSRMMSKQLKTISELKEKGVKTIENGFKQNPQILSISEKTTIKDVRTLEKPCQNF